MNISDRFCIALLGLTCGDAVRTVTLPPWKSITGWDVSEYKNRWDLIENKLRE